MCNRSQSTEVAGTLQSSRGSVSVVSVHIPQRQQHKPCHDTGKEVRHVNYQARLMSAVPAEVNQAKFSMRTWLDIIAQGAVCQCLYICT